MVMTALRVDSFPPARLQKPRAFLAMGGTMRTSGRGPLAAGEVRDSAGRDLVAACLRDDGMARSQFQQQFGSLIYDFPTRVGSGSDVEGGDFYLYLFENDRLYRRLRTYRGVASLGAFLRGYVLPDLLTQFQAMRGKKALDTFSLESSAARLHTSSHGAVEGTADSQSYQTPAPGAPALLTELNADKRLLVKLLYIEDFELDPADIQLLARRSGRSVHDVIELVENARASVRAREVARQEWLDEAESAAQWILRYQRQLAALRDRLANLPPPSGEAERLRETQAELERKQAWRAQQRERALGDSRRATVTLRYREIAALLNAPIGSISAQITRLRQELTHLAARPATPPFECND